MAKDSFKIKKSLHLKPTDSSEVDSPEVGDIIVDSSDDNKLKLYADGEFATIAGSGGAVANFFSDFDKLTPTLAQASVADDAVVFLPIDDNKKSKKITYTAAGSALYEVAASADLEGAQGLMTIWIKTDVQGVTVSTTTDGVKQSTLSVLATGKWKQYEIPYVVGGTDQGLIVESANAGDVNIDEPFVGLAPAGYIQDVGQAHFVGSLTYNAANCVWATASTVYDSFPVDADCIASNVNGSVTAPDTKIPAIKILNARTDGYYRIEHHGLLYISNQTGACLFSLSSTGSFEDQGVTYIESADRTGHQIIGDFRFETSGDKQVQVISYRLGGTGGECNVFGNDIVSSTFSVHFYPDASSTIVAQDAELTAATANELSFKVNTAVGTVISENYDWIDGNCSIAGTGSLSCNFKNIFTEIPSCRATVENSLSDFTVQFSNMSTSGFSVQTRVSGTASPAQIGIHCSKQGADVNKSATIVGKFEQIESSDLVALKYDKSSVQVIPNNVVSNVLYDNQVYDNSNGAYNTTTGVFTAPKDGIYKICAGWMWDAASWSIDRAMWFYVGDKIPQRSETTITNSNFYSMFGCDTVKLAKNETQILARVQQNSGSNRQNIASNSYNYVTVEEQASTESIVKNLLAESSQTKCQTKYLSANATTTGFMPDLQFNNLIIGKKYSITFATRQVFSSNFQSAEIVHNGKTLLKVGGQFDTIGNQDRVYQVGHKPMFTATSTVLQSSAFLQTGGYFEGSPSNLDDFTNVTLCQLPDTVLDTEEF